MNNEPVAIVKKITIGGIDNFPIEQFVRLKEGTLLYTHPVNPYQSITNTKIEPTVVSYTHPVKEQDESFDRTASHMAGEYVSYKKELTDEEWLITYQTWALTSNDPLVLKRAILRKAQEK